MTKFSWPTYPKNDAEFEALMSAIDLALTSEGLKPFQKPFHVSMKLWDAFKWEGNVFPAKHLAALPGYDGDVLLAKAHRWYEQTYGEQLKGGGTYGFAPARLGNAVWRVRAGLTYGSVQLFVDRKLSNSGRTFVGAANPGPATFNILCAVESLPQGLADRLPESALREHMEFHVLMHQALQWREELPNTELFKMAHADYDESTASVLGCRYGQAKWAAQQSVEKTLKGLLTIGGATASAIRAKGHDLKQVAAFLKERHQVELSPQLLALCECSPGVRYGEIPTTEFQALAANHAVLGILDELRRSSSVDALISMQSAKT